MPVAEVVGVPAVAGLAELAGLALLLRGGLGDDVPRGRVGDGVIDLGAVRVVLEAVVVVEVAQASDARLTVVVVELVVTGRRALEELERAPVLVERVLEVRVVAVLVLLVAEHGHQRRLHRLDLRGGGVLRLVAHGRAGALVAGVGLLLLLDGATGLARDVADGGEHGRRARRVVGPRVVVAAAEPAVRIRHHRAGRGDNQDRRETRDDRETPGHAQPSPEFPHLLSLSRERNRASL